MHAASHVQATVALWLQASTPEHRVIESKPDNAVEDLRFHRPWPELQHFADSVDLHTADDITHKHIPYGKSIGLLSVLV